MTEADTSPTVLGFTWTARDEPPVLMPGAANGFCIRDAFCALLGWPLDSDEAASFPEYPPNSDTLRLAEHLGLRVFNLREPEQWNQMIANMDHPGVAIFYLHAVSAGHSAYVHHVHALMHHWPTRGGLPSTDSPFMGWPLGADHIALRPELDFVIVDLREPQGESWSPDPRFL